MAGRSGVGNYGGLLSGIAGGMGLSNMRIGNQGLGDALSSSLGRAVAPKLNMEDPDSLEKYADWAQRNGKEEQAAQYRQAATQKRKEIAMKQRQAGVMQSSMVGQQSAQQGDVRGVDIQRRLLQEQLESPDISAQEQRFVMSELQRLTSMRPAAAQMETQNKIKGVTGLESLLESGRLNENQRVKVENQRDMLLQDAEVASGVNDLKAQQYLADKREKEKIADEYIAQNQIRIQQAVASKDSEGISSLIAEAPPGAGGKVQALTNSLVNLQNTTEKWNEEQRLMRTPLDLEGVDRLYGDLDEALFKPIKKAYEVAANYQKANFKDGLWVNEAARTRAQELLQKAESTATTLSFNAAQQEAARTYREKANDEAEIERLTLSLSEPISDRDIKVRASLSQKADKDGKLKPLTEEDYNRARESLEQQREDFVNRRIAQISGEEMPEEESSFDLNFVKGAIADNVPLDVIANQYGITVEELKRRVGIEEEEEMSFIERVRSKLSPMGTYGGKAPSLSDLANGGR